MADFRKSTLREYFESIVIAVILALFIRTFVVQAFKIPTGSMEENLLIGDHLLVNKFIFGPSESRLERALLPLGTIKRHDVLVFKYPEEPDRDFIKRVIGLPGETIWAKHGSVWVKSPGQRAHRLSEPYLHRVRTASFPHTALPQKCYFMMGDNRGRSDDSRMWGCEPRGDMIGIARVRYWPLDRIGLL
jgi:signal peptidase I